MRHNVRKLFYKTLKTTAFKIGHEKLGKIMEKVMQSHEISKARKRTKLVVVINIVIGGFS